MRKGLSLCPEYAGYELSEARQGNRWLHELLPELTTPYVNINGEPYFTFERDARIAIPVRWFQEESVTHVQCWDVEVSDYSGDLWSLGGGLDSPICLTVPGYERRGIFSSPSQSSNEIQRSILLTVILHTYSETEISESLHHLLKRTVHMLLTTR